MPERYEIRLIAPPGEDLPHVDDVRDATSSADELTIASVSRSQSMGLGVGEVAISIVVSVATNLATPHIEALIRRRLKEKGIRDVARIDVHPIPEGPSVDDGKGGSEDAS